MRPAKTHFEQIPVETVLKIAKKLPEPENDLGGNDSVNETRDEVSPPHDEGWRAVAHLIQHEQDSKRMGELVEKLLTELDERQLRKNGAIGRSRPSY